MARVSCQVRRKLDVPKQYETLPFIVNLRDESPPDGKFDFSDFLSCKTSLIDNTSPEGVHGKDKSDFTCSQSPLSVRREFEDSNSEVNADLFDLLNAVEPKIHDQKKPTDSLSDDFSNGSNSMKVKVSESQADGLFSDLLSISLLDCNPSVCSGRSVSPVCNLNLSDFAIPELCHEENLNVPSGKNINSSGETDFNLSDILSSICIDETDRPSSKPSKESLHCNQSLCLDDINLGEVKLQDFSAKKADSGINISSNLSQDFTDGKIVRGTSCKKPDNDVLSFGNHLKSSAGHNDVGFSFFDTKSSEQVSLDCFSIQDLVRDINVQNDSSLGTSLDSTKSNGFSFFCDPSENQLTFSQMLDEDNRNGNKAQQNDSTSDKDSISMMDLFNSIRSSKDGSSASESSGYFSNEIEKKNGSTCDDEDDDQVLAAIDLSTCIKSFEDKSNFNPPLPVETEVMDQNCPSPSKYLFHDDHSLHMPLKNSVISQAPRMNLKQSLFAKALSCKSKKDAVLAHKVANIKINLLNKVFCREVPVDQAKNPLFEVAVYSDKSIVQCNGRRNFGTTIDMTCIASIS